MTTKRLDINKKVDDFLEKLPEKHFKQVYTSILNLGKDCRPHDSSKLHGYDDLFRVDIGEYRVIYSFNDEVVYIHLVGKRNDDEAYKKFKRQR